MTHTNQLYFGDNLSVLREHIPDEIRRPHLPRPALQLQRHLQRPLQRALRRGLRRPDHRLRRHLALDHRLRARLPGSRYRRLRRARRSCQNVYVVNAVD